MKILFVSAVLPYPLYSGGQVRMYNLLKLLSGKHSITLFSFIRNDEERYYKKNLSFLSRVETIYRGRAFQPRYLLKAFGTYPLLLASYDNSEMRRLIGKELAANRYDLLHIEPFYVYPSIPEVSLPIVVGEHNIEYTVYENYSKSYAVRWLQPVIRRDAQKIRVWEELVWRKATRVTSVSREDSLVIREKTNHPCRIVPNGVDTEWFRFKTRQLNVERPTFLFVGNFAWAPNIEAVRTLITDIWPRVKRALPGGVLTIVGKRFPASLQLQAGGDVLVREDVDDIRKVFWTADILLAPMGISGGSKFKLLEAMASGTAVVTTQSGRIGIDANPGSQLLEAGSSEQFAEAVTSIYSDIGKTKEMTRNARRLVEEKYDWRLIANTLETVWKESV